MNVQPKARMSSLIPDKQEEVWYKIIITEIDFDTFVNSKKGTLAKEIKNVLLSKKRNRLILIVFSS